MITLLALLAFLLPVPIALSTPAATADGTTIESALAVRQRLVWNALAMAGITVAHYLATAAFLPSSAATMPITIYFVWMPWALLFQYRYVTLYRKSTATWDTRRRAASLRPRPVPRSARIGWSVAVAGYLVGVVLFGVLAWQQEPSDLARQLPLTLMVVPAGVLYWLSKRACEEEPETYPAARADLALTRLYEQRRTLGSWTFLGLFTIQAITHLTFAASALGETPYSPALAAGVGIAAAVNGTTYWVLRRRLDQRIKTVLKSASGPEDTP